VWVALLVGVGVMATVISYPAGDRTLHGHAPDHGERDP
jgi:hypothetical protein